MPPPTVIPVYDALGVDKVDPLQHLPEQPPAALLLLPQLSVVDEVPQGVLAVFHLVLVLALESRPIPHRVSTTRARNERWNKKSEFFFNMASIFIDPTITSRKLYLAFASVLRTCSVRGVRRTRLRCGSNRLKSSLQHVQASVPAPCVS